MSDPIETVRALAPEVDVSPELLARTRSDLLSTITSAARSTDASMRLAGRRRPKRRWLLPVAAAAVLATSAAGWAIAQRGGATNTSIACPADTSNESWAVITATSGDPIADCGAVWRELNGSEPPAMTAYRGPGADGGVQVRLASEPAPEGATALPAGVAVDTQIIQLNEAISDIGHGVTTETCLDEDAARARVQAEFDRLGVDGWRIDVRDGSPIDDSHPCTWAIVRGPDAMVELLGSKPIPARYDVFRDYAVALQAGLSAECLDLADAEALARRLATESDLPDPYQQIDVSAVPTPSAECTTATVSVGGRVAVVLRGPAR